MKRPRGVLAALAFVPALAGLGPCADEADVRAAHERREALLRSTAPKSELWEQIERKGTALKEAKALEAAVASLAGRVQAVRAEVEAAEAQLAALRQRRTEQDALLAQALTELEAARSEAARRTNALREIANRRREAAP